MKILIVDDNASFRALLRQLLTGVAVEVDECGSGEEALAAYARGRPDLVLMDLRMHGMDGLSATRAILSQNEDARVWVLTSYDDEALRSAAHAAGACGYALKDDLQSLTRLLRAAS